MLETPGGTITEHFSELEDPRADNRRHLLVEIIVIAICEPPELPRGLVHDIKFACSLMSFGQSHK
jgi:hypothetical protein